MESRLLRKNKIPGADNIDTLFEDGSNIDSLYYYFEYQDTYFIILM